LRLLKDGGQPLRLPKVEGMKRRIPMRVLMFSWEYPPHVIGGLGKHVMELTPALARQGVEVHLVTPAWAGGEPRETLGGMTVHRVPPPSQPNDNVHTTAWQTNVKLERYAEELWAEVGGFDLIHAHDWLVAFAGCALKHNFKIPLIATIHATERGRGGGYLTGEVSQAIHSTEWWLTFEAWRIITCSQYMAQQVQEYFDVPGDKVDVVPNGIDTARFDRYEGVDLSHFRNLYALPEEKIVFYVGRVQREKGVHTLVNAMPRVLAQFPQAKFVIAGRGSELDSLRRRAWELGVGPKVLFTGFISDDDRDRLFRVASVAVFPSLYEPFGIVALEAMAAKCPVVVSEVGGLKEVVCHGETGVTVHPDDPESLAWGILHTLTRPDWAQARAAAAYRMVREEYNWDRIAARTLAVYERVVRERAETEW